MWMPTSKQASIHMRVRNIVMLVWGSLRLALMTSTSLNLHTILAFEIKTTYLGKTGAYQ